MSCRVGMTTRPRERRTEWEAVYPNLRGWEILASGLTYQEATAYETRVAEQHGCDQDPGGPYVAGRVWSVYHFYYN